MDNKASKVNFVGPGGLPPGGAASNLNDSNNYHDNLRPITLEDEDFISNIKESKTLEFVFVKGQNQVIQISEKNALGQTLNEEDGDWDDLLTPSQTQNRT